jgi:prefoldin subunit 5
MSIKFDNNKQPYIDLGQSYKISINYEKVVDETYLKKAKEDLRETPEIREQALKELRELIRSKFGENSRKLYNQQTNFFKMKKIWHI